jgi:hypothetical protein
MTHGDYIRFKAAYLAQFSRSEYRGKIGRVISNNELLSCGLVGVKVLINGQPVICCIDDIEVIDDPKTNQYDSLCIVSARLPRD